MNWRNIFITWGVTALAVWAAIWILSIMPGQMVTYSGTGFAAALVVGGFLGLLNAWVKPLLKLLSCGCIAITLGLFIFVLNAFVLWLAGWFARLVGVNFSVSFWGAIFGAIIISIVSFLLSMFLPDSSDTATS